ncbi:procollagen-lysine 5-dioxygenase [Aureococcus anophagefferens]|nr:procollagen-lysine 5-dioxygenase [Aureococcus anophagefferens]
MAAPFSLAARLLAVALLAAGARALVAPQRARRFVALRASAAATAELRERVRGLLDGLAGNLADGAAMPESAARLEAAYGADAYDAMYVGLLECFMDLKIDFDMGDDDDKLRRRRACTDPADAVTRAKLAPLYAQAMGMIDGSEPQISAVPSSDAKWTQFGSAASLKRDRKLLISVCPGSSAAVGGPPVATRTSVARSARAASSDRAASRSRRASPASVGPDAPRAPDGSGDLARAPVDAMAPWRRASSDDTRSSYKVQDEGKDSSKDDSPLSPSGRKRSVSNPEGGAGVRRSAGGIRDFASRARGTVAFAIPRRVGIGRKKMAPRVSQIASPSSRRFYEKELGEGRTKGLGGLHYMMRKGSVEDVRSRAFKDRDGVLDRFLSTRLAARQRPRVGMGRTWPPGRVGVEEGRGLWTQCLIAEDSTAHLVWDVIVACFVIAFAAVAR